MKANQPKPCHLLFVGGLSIAVTEKDIQDHFIRYTQVESIKIMIDRKTRQSKGYAMVGVPIEANLEKIFEDTHMLCGRKVDVQIAAKKSEKKKWKDELKKKKIFVNGLPLDFTGEMLEEYFRKLGKVRGGYIIKDFETSLSKGYGFIEFEEEEATQRILKMSLEINGQPIQVAAYKYKYEPKRDPQEEQEDSKEQLGTKVDGFEVFLSQKSQSCSSNEVVPIKKSLTTCSDENDSKMNTLSNNCKYEFLNNSQFLIHEEANLRINTSISATSRTNSVSGGAAAQSSSRESTSRINAISEAQLLSINTSPIATSPFGEMKSLHRVDKPTEADARLWNVSRCKQEQTSDVTKAAWSPFKQCGLAAFVGHVSSK